MTTPDLGLLLDVLRPYLAQMNTTLIQETVRRVPIPTLLPATVQATSAVNGVCQVIPDGGTDAIPARSLLGIPADGSRVMLLFQPPSGVFIVGFVGNYRTPRLVGGLWSRVTTQSIPNTTVTAISWTVETTDSDGFLTIPSTTFTIPNGMGGRYMAAVTLKYSSAPNQPAFVELSGPVRYGLTWRGDMPTGHDTVSISGWFTLVDGDTIVANAYQASGGALNLSAAQLELWRIAD